MKWTDTFPEKEGFYWYRESGGKPIVLYAEYDGDEWITDIPGSEVPEPIGSDDKGQWYGPIEPPEE